MSNRRIIPLRKEVLFRIIAVSLPLLLILFLELVLRISGYGEKYVLFNKVTYEDRPDYLVMNPDFAGKYFKDKGFQSDNQLDLFLRIKTDSTFRIFVQGASTVAGFPFYHGGSFPRMLKHRLSQTFPEKNIEVVNTGITAVNSYTLWDLTDDIIEQKPDLVILYIGHNEYYGALGVGSTSSYGSNPFLVRTYLFLKDFRFFQLLENSYANLFGRNDKGPKIGETTLMEVMVKEQSIPYHSNVFNKGLEQFESNLKRIIDKYGTANIPVILSTVVCNEKDIKPFLSDSIIDEKKYIEYVNKDKNQALRIANTNASAAYFTGRYYLRENLDSAKKYLHLAKELDLLRFRAPEQINNIIKALAEKKDLPCIDMKEAFLTNSPFGVVGDELLSEHVHPNVKGNFIMADAFYNKIRELGLIDDWNNYIPFDDAFSDIPVTEIDSLKGMYIVKELKMSWPFDLNMSGRRQIAQYYTGELTYEQKRAFDLYTNQASWKDVMLQSYELYKRNKLFSKGLHVAQSLILEYPEEAKVYRMAGEMCLKLDDPNKALYYYLKCNQLDRNSLSARELAFVYHTLNNVELTKKTLIEATQKYPGDKELDQMLKELDHVSK